MRASSATSACQGVFHVANGRDPKSRLRRARRQPRDRVASIGISLVLVASSFLLARETKELLIGEAAQPHVRDSMLRIAGGDPDLRCANGVVTVQMGPRQVIAALSAEFHDRLNTTQIEECVNRIEAAIKHAHPEVVALFIKPQTAETWRRRIAHLAAQQDEGA